MAAAVFASFSFSIHPPSVGTLTAHRPDKSSVERTKSAAKSIFIEAFTTTYSEYHKKSKSEATIEKWLRLKEGLTINTWLSNVFDEEMEEYTAGKKGVVHLINEKGDLVGWLSHSPVSETGELYLSQCALEENSRGKHIASLSFAEAIKHKAQEMFPGVKEVKLIARKSMKGQSGSTRRRALQKMRR